MKLLDFSVSSLIYLGLLLTFFDFFCRSLSTHSYLAVTFLCDFLPCLHYNV